MRSGTGPNDDRAFEENGALQRLAHTYIGPDVVFPNMPDPPPGFVTRITPESGSFEASGGVGVRFRCRRLVRTRGRG